MKVNVNEVDLKKVQLDAEQAFKDGFFCCEAVIETIIDNFKVDVPHEIIKLTSGMAVGAGKSGCICGALNGGVAALGMIFGRDEKRGPKDPEVLKCLSYVHELHDWFKDTNKKGATCCRVLTKEYDMGKAEHKPQCIYFTGLCAWKVAEIIARELGLKVTNNEMIERSKENNYA